MSNNTLSRAELTDSGEVQNIHYGDILTKFGDVVDCSKEEISFVADKSKLGSKISYLQNGDVIIADTAEDDAVGKATEILNIQFPVVSGLHTMACRPQFKFEPRYLGYYINSACYHNQLYPFMQGVKVTSVSKGNIALTEIRYPANDEQHKIASMLALVDARIEKQRTLIESLKLYKRGVLSKIFNAYKPISYKTIGQMASVFSGGTPRAGVTEYYGGSIPFIRSGEIHKEKTELFLTEKGLNNSSAKMVNKGDLLFALYGATSGEVSISKICGAINQAILCIRPQTDVTAEFLQIFLEYNKESIITKLLQGGQGNLSGELVKGLNIPIYDEVTQKIIVQTLLGINKTISLVNEYYDELSKVKKALLQQMFI